LGVQTIVFSSIRHDRPYSCPTECVRLPPVPPKRREKPRTPELAALAMAIEQRMTERGLTQQALADESGIDVRRIGDYVRGRYNPNVPNLRRLCEGLDLSVTELMDRAADLEEDGAEN
jgi:ribosome-binding protein aMBF1 (putative translation factor)